MKTFYKTILASVAAIFVLWLITLVFDGPSGIPLTGLWLFFASPVMFFVGLIVIIVYESGTDGRQVGQGLMLSSLLFILVGFVTCSSTFGL